jgi:hypothetical protein
LIPCADGGTSLDDWAVEGTLFENAISQAKLAQRTSHLAGILWHQGENDCSPEKLRIWRKIFCNHGDITSGVKYSGSSTYYRWLGRFSDQWDLWKIFFFIPPINQALEEFAKLMQTVILLAQKDLQPMLTVFISMLSQRLFGIRYYRAFRDSKHLLILTMKRKYKTTLYNRPIPKQKKSNCWNTIAMEILNLKIFYQN